MFVPEEKSILSDCRKVFNPPRTNKVIDIDEKLGRKPECIIIPLEKLFQETGPVIPPYRQSRISFIYIKKGKGQKIVGSHTVSVRNQMLFIIPPEVPSSSVYKTKRLKGYYMSLSLDCFLHMPFHFEHMLNAVFFSLTLIPYQYVDPDQAKILESIFESILSEARNHKKNRGYLIACKLIEFTIECGRILKTEELATNNHPLAVQFIDLIQEYYKISHSVSFYAKKLFVHPNSLNATTKQYLLQTAKATIDSKILSEAQYLLQHTKLTIKEIAYETGFKSSTHFFRFFRKYKRMSPAAYKKNHLKL